MLLSGSSLQATESGIRILVVDDHKLLRDAICGVLLAEPGFRVVGDAGDAETAVRHAGRLRPDVVLLDVMMPGNNPVATVPALLRASPRTKVIILSMCDEQPLVERMLGLGAAAFLHKGVSRQDLTAVIRAVNVSSELVTVSLPRVAVGGRPAGVRNPLSGREREVLTLVAQAMTNRQIAGRLSITEGTVKRHLRNIFDKLGAVSRIDAVNRATAAGLISRQVS